MEIKSISKRSSGGKDFYSLIITDGGKEYHGSSSDAFFETAKVGDLVTCEVKPAGREYMGNQQYYFNIKKAFPKKDYAFDKRKVALECAVKYSSSPDEVIGIADIFLAWLSK